MCGALRAAHRLSMVSVGSDRKWLAVFKPVNSVSMATKLAVLMASKTSGSRSSKSAAVIDLNAAMVDARRRLRTSRDASLRQPLRLAANTIQV